jgi:transcriptional regulator with XRE-family HTH domain
MSSRHGQGTAGLEELSQVRLRNLKAVCDQRSVTGVARALGFTNNSYVSQILHGRRAITEKFCRKAEKQLGLSAGWLDRDRPLPGGQIELDAVLLNACQLVLGKVQGSEKLTDMQKSRILAMMYSSGSADHALAVQLVGIAQN